MIYHPPGAWTADDDYRLNQIIKQANPPRVTAPVLLRDDAGRPLGEHARAGAQVPAVQVWHKQKKEGVMPRHKNGDWDLPTNAEGRISSWDYVPIAVLMDIRDELQVLNRILGCTNFLRVPRILDAINANTKKRKRKPKP